MVLYQFINSILIKVKILESKNKENADLDLRPCSLAPIVGANLPSLASD